MPLISKDFARATPGAATTTSISTAAAALSLSNTDLHTLRSTGEVARSA